MNEYLVCKECGERAIRYHHSQKYCAACAAAKRSRRPRSPKLDLSDVPKNVCVSKVPPEKKGWSTHGKSLRLISAEAAELGMTYGQYMSAIQSGSIEDILIARGMTPSQWRAKLRAAKRKVGN